MDKAVVLVSGGVCSAVAAMAAKEQYEVALLHVAWGHRAAEREADAFEAVAGALRTDKTLVAEMPFYTTIGGSSRASKRIAIEDAGAVTNNAPSTFTLGLLPALLSVASSWAAALGASRIIFGVCESQGPGGPLNLLYPDHRPDFVHAFNLMLNYAKAARRDLKVEAPLIDLGRAEVIRLGQRLGVPFGQTWSCYLGGEAPCGRCLACAHRVAGFAAAALPDPLLTARVPAMA